MAFDRQELDELKLRISSAITGKRLSKWQVGFLVNINSLIDKHGTRLRLSDKQLAKLDEIAPGSGWKRPPPGLPPRDRSSPNPSVAATDHTAGAWSAAAHRAA